ncbi:MAG: hypothetical protein AAFX52_11100 [Pseudomonadota bacterium]
MALRPRNQPEPEEIVIEKRVWRQPISWLADTWIELWPRALAMGLIVVFFMVADAFIGR